MTQSLMFWKASPNIGKDAAAVAQELDFGDEVEGLIDLPVKEVIERIKAAFPKCEERAGLLVCRSGAGMFEVSWTWQVIKVQFGDLGEVDRQTLIAIGREFGCEAYPG